MATRYTVGALTDWGPDSAHVDGYDDSAPIYTEFHGQLLAPLIEQAEKASLVNEAQYAYLEEYRRAFNDWVVVDHIDPYK